MGPRLPIDTDFNFERLNIEVMETFIITKQIIHQYPWDQSRLQYWFSQSPLKVPYYVAWRPEIMPIRWRNLRLQRHDEEIKFGWTVPDAWYDLMQDPPKELQDEFDKEILVRERTQYTDSDSYILAEDEYDLSSTEDTYKLYDQRIYLSDEDEYDWISVKSSHDSVGSELTKSSSMDSACEALFGSSTTSDISTDIPCFYESGLEDDVDEDKTESDIPVRILNTVLPMDNVKVSDMIAEHNLLMQCWRAYKRASVNF